MKQTYIRSLKTAVLRPEGQDYRSLLIVKFFKFFNDGPRVSDFVNDNTLFRELYDHLEITVACVTQPSQMVKQHTLPLKQI